MQDRETPHDVELVALDQVERWAIARAEHRQWLAAQPGRLQRIRQRRARRHRARTDRRHQRGRPRPWLARGPRLVAQLLRLDRRRDGWPHPGGTPAWTASSLARPGPPRPDRADPTNRQGADR